MNINSLKKYFHFSREQRLGIFILFLIIIVLQLGYYFVNFNLVSKTNPEEQKWLSLQSQIDAIKGDEDNNAPKTYSYNPNFITDYKGYKLGMSVAEIDRLMAFRKQGKFANSPEEFQKVTGISDSLLDVMRPNFKFPDWVNNKKEYKIQEKTANLPFAKKEKIAIIDINQATYEDLIKIYGIGETIANRILDEKQKLGSFVSMEQMDAIWGLTPEVIADLNLHFKILIPPKITKIDINNASLKELAQFPYFRYALAKQIITYRSMNGEIKNIEDLTKIKGFSVDKAKIIALYLNF
jgi:DNA uptake protein ComE-like DNA-binding protein